VPSPSDYGLAILALAKIKKETALFIEEIESHQDSEAIRKLIEHLLEISKSNNLQLFITTHNQSVWNYLYYNYRNHEERKENFRCFHIAIDKNTGVVQSTNEEGIANIQPDLHG
jgi:AAA15 family ATPase/GTPase